MKLKMKKSIMRKRIIRKGMMGILTATLIMLGTCMGVFAEGEINLDDNDNTRAGETAVDANVLTDGPVAPTYVIAIPQSISFGNVQAPVKNTSSYKDVELKVRAVSIDNLTAGSGVAVLVQDSNPNYKQGDGFLLTSKTNSEAVMNYQILGPDGTSIENQQSYTNGYLYNCFVTVGDAKDTLRLDQKQLYGKEMSAYGGAYSGTLNFYTRIVSIDEFQ